ncbi:MAG: hypothetical protein H7X91_02855 [Burkholderiales bacterium]|nr:hypothetical protein [Burkholderiales bacterium]
MQITSRAPGQSEASGLPAGSLAFVGFFLSGFAIGFAHFGRAFTLARILASACAGSGFAGALAFAGTDAFTQRFALFGGDCVANAYSHEHTRSSGGDSDTSQFFNSVHISFLLNKRKCPVLVAWMPCGP